MNNRLTFLEPTNFTVPIPIFNTLVDDAFYFGYVKNNQANISGLLNHLIPNLTEYRKDLHLTFLKANNDNEELANTIESNIYKHYFSKYDYCDDGVAIIPFRVNKEHMQQFLEIVDSIIYTFNMDFTGYVRSLLVEYCSKRLTQREYFFYYTEINNIRLAIKEHLVCTFYTDEEKNTFVPVSIELSRITEQNLIVGYNPEDENAYILPLSYIKKIVVTTFIYNITEEDSEFINEILETYENERSEEK